MSNASLNTSKINKNDEYYTLLSDIEKELSFFKDQLKGKIIYCNCDDFNKSNFVKYFTDNFKELKLKKLISTGLNTRKGLKKSFENDEIKIEYFDITENGSFDSKQSLELLKECDIVITNPPFSLTRKYFDLLIEYKKSFLFLSNLNSVKYKTIFPYIAENKVNIGYSSGSKSFVIPEHYETGNISKTDGIKYAKLGNVIWLTNLDISDKKEITFTKKYDKSFAEYDNKLEILNSIKKNTNKTYQTIINIDKTKDIPDNYFELMGVPISFLEKLNRNQFEIIGILGSGQNKYYYGKALCYRKELYSRIIIKRSQSPRPTANTLEVGACKSSN